MKIAGTLVTPTTVPEVKEAKETVAPPTNQ